MNGKLILASTPIGNLGDISKRLAEAFAAADLILCEDTRNTRKLLTHLDVTEKNLMSMPVYSEKGRISQVLQHLEAGESVVFASDAGVPVISDPGFMLVNAVLDADFEVSIIPGPNAAVSALAMSGLPGDRFVFEGFLPPKGSKRNKRMKAMADEERTIVLYESPHRLPRTVKELADACGPERIIAITRELTKLHEELWRGTLAEAVTYTESKAARGEYTLVLAGASRERGKSSAGPAS